MKGHLSKEEAIDFYNASDKKNVETVINRSKMEQSRMLEQTNRRTEKYE